MCGDIWSGCIRSNLFTFRRTVLVTTHARTHTHNSNSDIKSRILAAVADTQAMICCFSVRLIDCAPEDGRNLRPYSISNSNILWTILEVITIDEWFGALPASLVIVYEWIGRGILFETCYVDGSPVKLNSCNTIKWGIRPIHCLISNTQIRSAPSL